MTSGTGSSTGNSDFPFNTTCTPSWNTTIPICKDTHPTGPFFAPEWNNSSCQYECQPYTCYSHQSCLSNPSWYGCDDANECITTLSPSWDQWNGQRTTTCHTTCTYEPICEPSYNETIPICVYEDGTDYMIDNGTWVGIGPQWNNDTCQYECQNIICPSHQLCESSEMCGLGTNPIRQCITHLNFYQTQYHHSWKSSVCSTGCEAIPIPSLPTNTCIPMWNITNNTTSTSWNTTIIIPNCISSPSGPFYGIEWNITSCQYECQPIPCPTHERCEQQGWCNANGTILASQMCSTKIETVGTYQQPWLTSICDTSCAIRPYIPPTTCTPDAYTPIPSCAINATRTDNGTWIASGIEWNTTSCQYECIDHQCSSHTICERDNWCSTPGSSCHSQTYIYDHEYLKSSYCFTNCQYESVCLPSNITDITCTSTNHTNNDGSRMFTIQQWNTTTCSYQCETITCPKPTYCSCGYGYICEANIDNNWYHGVNRTNGMYLPVCTSQCIRNPQQPPTFDVYEERDALVTSNGYAEYINTGNNSTDMNIPYQNQERTIILWVKAYNNYYWWTSSEQIFFGMTKKNITHSCRNSTTIDDDLVIGLNYGTGEIFARTCRNSITIGAGNFGQFGVYQWIHVAFVYQPSSHTAQLYVNGYTNGPQYWSYDLNTSRERVILGLDPFTANGYGSNFNGEISNMNFYRFALTTEAIYHDISYGSISTPTSRWGVVTYNGFPQYGNLYRNQTFTLVGSRVHLVGNETNISSSTGGVQPISSTGNGYPSSSTGGWYPPRNTTTAPPTSQPPRNTTTRPPTTQPPRNTTTAPPTSQPPRNTTTAPPTQPPRNTTTAPPTQPPRNTTTAPPTQPPRNTTTAPPTQPPRNTTTAPPTQPPQNTTTRPPTQPPRNTTTAPPTQPPQNTTTTPPTTQAPTTAAPTTPVPIPTTFNWTSVTERTWKHPFTSSITFIYNNPPHNIPLYVRVQDHTTLITMGTTSSFIHVTTDVRLLGNNQMTGMTVEILRDDSDGIPIAADHLYTQVVTRSAISRVVIPEPILSAMANGEDTTISAQPCPATANTGAIVGGVIAAMTILLILTNIATHVITKRQQQVQSASKLVTENGQTNLVTSDDVIVVV